MLNFRTNWKCFFCLLWFLLLALVAVGAPALAETQNGLAASAKISTPPGYGVNGYRRQHAEFEITKISAMIDLDYVPAYTGSSKFIFGTAMRNTTGGPVTTIVSSIKENRDGASQWYSSALENYGWRLEETGLVISATHTSGNRIQIIFNPPSQQGYRNDMVIKYCARR